ncbi:MAG TPA: phosphoribosylformylglycinamidine synthase I [bacterium]|nr:phosphoribosylformylglycinamidine synthase I [bacterium]HPS29438.1 phosphoribosylformylglycinamidine synthase I [bacterium]
MNKVSVLILTGYGINCDVETGWAFTMAGAHKVERVHINRIINGEVNTEDFQIMVFPGGFSFGDHIASGRVLGLKIKKEMGEKVRKFVTDGKLVLGICNGFQTLVKMGILPGNKETVFGKQVATLTHNDSAKYEDRWVRIKVNSENISPFLKGIDAFDVAVRHGEGKFMAQKNHLRDIKNKELIAFQYVDKNGEPARNYPENPNGSELSIAGITNETGTVLGLMPHPEVFINRTQHPHWTRNENIAQTGEGLKLFVNAVQYVLREL